MGSSLEEVDLSRRVNSNPKETEHLMWTEKYKPQVPSDLVGNKDVQRQFVEWLAEWDEVKDIGAKRDPV